MNLDSSRRALVQALRDMRREHGMLRATRYCTCEHEEGSAQARELQVAERELAHARQTRDALCRALGGLIFHGSRMREGQSDDAEGSRMTPRELTPAQLRQRQQAALKHGIHAKSETALKVRWRVVRQLVTRLRQAMPWLQPSDEHACRAWAELEYIASEAFVYLRGNGIVNAAGEPRKLLSEYRQLRQAQLQYERELGMTPAARASLGLKVAEGREADLASELAALRLARAQSATKRAVDP